MSQRGVVKDPNEVLDYKVDMADQLAGGETIASAAWTIVDAGPTKDSESFDATTATVWLRGGTAGTVCRVTCRITTSIGRVRDVTLFVEIRSR